MKRAWVLLLFVCSAASAQQRVGSFMAWGKDNGLPPSLYYSVFQSSDGYLWIGSASGLVRFDGKRFKTFIADFENPNSPSDNVIYDFAEDHNKNLWICGFIQGVTRYNLRTGRFKKYPRLSQDSNPEYGVLRVLKDNAGDLWFATAGRGLAKYLPEKDTFQFFIPNPSRPYDGSDRNSNHITSIAEDRRNKNILWLSCFDGLYSFDKKTASFTKYPFFSSWSTDGNSLFMCVAIDEDNVLWLGTWFQGLFSFDPATKTFRSYRYHQASRGGTEYAINDIKMVNDSLLYLASFNHGLLCFNRNTRDIRALLTTAQLPQGSSGIDIQRVSLTPNAGLFAGGNYYLYQQHQAFNRLGSFVAFDSSFRAGGSGLPELNEVVFDGQRRGYWMACSDSRALHFFDSTLRRQTVFPAPGSHDGFRDVAVDKLGRVWATGWNKGLFVIEEKTNAFIPSKWLGDSLSPEVLRLESDSKGNLWLLQAEGLLHYNISTLKKTFFPFNSLLASRGLRFRYGQLRVDQNDNAWLSSNAGLLHADLKHSKLTHFTPGSSGLANISIKSMTIDKQGYVWLGFHYNGLQVFDPKTQKVVSTHKLEHGLPGMQVNSLTTDQQGRIWAGFAAGLGMFDPAVKVWQLFNRNDGIVKDYLDGPTIATTDGRVFLTQRNGFICFSGDVYKASRLQPVLHLTAVSIDGKPLSDSVLQAEQRLNLPYSTKEISIEYAAMDWVYPLRTKYFYRVENIHKKDGWIPNDQASIQLAGLSPGTYVVHLYAVNSDGLRSQEITLPILIAQPFWMEWWFIVFVALAFVGLVYLLYRYRIRQLQRLQEMRNTISRNLHDDIGASLSNISILNELAKRNAGNGQKATTYLVKAGEDIQRISESLSDIVWNINPRYDELDNLFIRMKRYAADMLDGKNIEAQLGFPNEWPHKMKMSMEQRRDLYLVFKEAVHNLVKYSGATEAEIRISLWRGSVELLVRDNGKGFDLNQVTWGNGLQNMKQRAAKWKGQLQIDSAPGSGTCIRMHMRIG